MDNTSQAFDHFDSGIMRAARIHSTVSGDQLKDTGGQIEDMHDIGAPSCLARDRRVCNFKDLCLRMKRNLNAPSFIIICEHFIAQDRGHQRGNALLPIDQYPLPRRRAPIFQFAARIFPSDKIPNRIPLLERFVQITNLRRLPPKRPLYLRYRNFTTLHPRQQRLNRLRSNGIFLRCHIAYVSSCFGSNASRIKGTSLKTQLTVRNCEHCKARTKPSTQTAAPRFRVYLALDQTLTQIPNFFEFSYKHSLSIKYHLRIPITFFQNLDGKGKRTNSIF
jgi:hypothetical protein